MESLVFWLYLFIPLVIGLTQEGCSDGWVYFNQLCYLYTPQTVDAMVAKGICSTKGATLTSIWDDEERHFITNTLLPPLGQSLIWTGLIPKPNKDRGWVWLDSSIADIQPSGSNKYSKDACGALNSDGMIIFRDCWETLPGFVCKKSLEMTYVASDVDLWKSVAKSTTADPPKMLFERIWPPKLQDFSNYFKHIAHTQVSYVSHETDCAYYCSHVTSCQAFTIYCSLPWKCNQYSCDLFQSRS